MNTFGGSTRRTCMAWCPTYQVLYPVVTVERVSPLASVADSTASWCQSSGLCWVVLLDGHTQWHNQDEQVTQAQHGHSMGTFITCVTGICYKIRHVPPCKNFKLDILRSLLGPFSATNTIPSVLLVCSLHVHMKFRSHMPTDY